MSIILFANNANATLAGGINPASITANLAAGTGSLFPAPSGGNYFVATLTDAQTGLINEIVHVTNVTGDVVTLVRAQEGTTAQSWLAGDLFANLWTAGQAADMLQVAQSSPARIVTASGVFVMTSADAFGRVGLNRLTSVAVSSTTLPADASQGDVYRVEDLASNFNAFPVTVSYPAGMSGPGGSPSATLNVNKQCAAFAYYGSNLWSFAP